MDELHPSNGALQILAGWGCRARHFIRLWEERMTLAGILEVMGNKIITGK